MTRRFDSFVIFAAMRTGSNFLESNLDLFPGLKTYGEAFNPHFMLRPGTEEVLGITLDERNDNPVALFDRMKARTQGIPGFRFFHDHDRRIFEHVIDDPAVAKVVLSRNLVDAYVSRAIARETNQWALGNVKHAKKAQAVFVEEEFALQISQIKGFQSEILGRLQRSGQTAYYINYDDLRDLDVINGLARFLGEETALEALSTKFKKQNPEPLSDKVKNYPALVAAVGKVTAFDLDDVPNFEPRRPAAVPSYIAAAKAPLLFMPVQGGPVEPVRQWLAAIDGAEPDALITGMRQKELRKWKRTHRGHRSFAVLTHPAPRAHTAFTTHFLTDGPEAYPEIGMALREQYGVALPAGGVPGEDWTPEAHRAAFLGYLAFVKRNLAGQTPIRVDPSWATQAAVIQGYAQVVPPDHLLRASQLADGLARLGAEIGLELPEAPVIAPDTPFSLGEILDDQVELAVHGAYQRDYMLFGFGPWAEEPGA